MDLSVRSPDGVRLHAEVSGAGRTALVFVHGWLGSGRWWDAQPTNVAGNRKWFADFEVEVMPGVGHYPMLERPDQFTAALRRVL